MLLPIFGLSHYEFGGYGQRGEIRERIRRLSSSTITATHGQFGVAGMADLYSSNSIQMSISRRNFKMRLRWIVALVVRPSITIFYRDFR